MQVLRADTRDSDALVAATSPVWRTLSARVLFALQVAVLLAMTATVASRLWQDRVWFGWALVGVALVAWAPELSRPRARRWWFAYVTGIFIYTLLRSYADETVVPIQTGYVIDADRVLFAGSSPVEWLQDHLFSPGHVSWLDIAAVQVHWSFFIAPHLAAVLIFLWRRDLFSRYAILVVGIMYLGLLLFFAVPTTPPWLAGRGGDLTGVFRIMDFVGGQVDASTYRSLSDSLAEPNSVAAMPSIHMAVTFAMYLWAREHEPRLALPLLAYCGLMGFSLVYLAEHYVLDLLAGVVCAVVSYAIVRRFLPLPDPAPAPIRPESSPRRL